MVYWGVVVVGETRKAKRGVILGGRWRGVGGMGVGRRGNGRDESGDFRWCYFVVVVLLLLLISLFFFLF